MNTLLLLHQLALDSAIVPHVVANVVHSEFPPPPPFFLTY